MGGIAKHEHTAFAEMIRDPMIHVVGGEPVHALDVDAHPLNDPLAYIVPRQALMLAFDFLSDGADKPGAALIFKRKDRQEIGRIQGDVQLAVHCCSVRFYVGNIEEVRIYPARKANPKRFAHRRSRAVTPGKVACPAGQRASIWSPKVREYVILTRLKVHEFGTALDLDAGLCQAIDQQALVLVLRE